MRKFTASLLFSFALSTAEARYCTQVFGSSSHPFYIYLFDNNPVNPKDRSASVKYVGIAPDGRLMFRQKRTLFTRQLRSWESYFNIVPEGSVPQGDLRTFIYLAGPELAQKFGFEFREDKDGVVLFAPSAARLERIIPALNRYLIIHKKEPIAYLPMESGFLRLGESLNLAVGHDHKDGVQARFAYADHDLKVAPHEVSFHLGSILFSQIISKKSDVLNNELRRVVRLLWHSKLPESMIVAARLTEARETEMDLGNANSQYYMARFRKIQEMQPYTQHTSDSELKRPLYSSLSVLAHPFYSPAEYVARQLIQLLSLESEFQDIPHLVRSRDYRTQKEYAPDPIHEIQLSPEARAEYVKIVRRLIERQEYNPNNSVVPPRQRSMDWVQTMFKGMDQRIQDLLDAFDAIGPIP